jgi:cellulose synthase/poly-beta-1,6-N-acetylglucosamine synthase-like glycosyltransferase
MTFNIFSIIPAATMILWIFSFFLILYAGYYCIISLFSLHPLKPLAPFPPQNKFAIIIAARNEGRVIGNLISTLKNQDYPKELYEIFVIPNRCVDHTKAAALESGAAVLECPLQVNSKGQVLTFALEQLMKSRKDFDAFCVFDADNLVDPGFLKEMNNALCSGFQAAQGYRESKNPTDSIISCCYTIYYYTLNRFYNHARRVLGLPAVVNGTGFMVSAAVLRRLNGWNTKTMTEDLEFSALCALNGIRIHWAPDALFYDEQPLTFIQSWHQRRRWSFGMQQCLRQYWKPLLYQAVMRRKIACMDILIMFSTTHMQVLGFFAFLLTIALTVFRIRYSLFPQTELTHKLLLSLDTSYLTSVFAAVGALMLERKSLRKMSKGILFMWFFVISWIPINLICLCSKTTEWKQITHVRNLSLKDIAAVAAFINKP